jgi:hypothetical protein
MLGVNLYGVLWAPSSWYFTLVQRHAGFYLGVFFNKKPSTCHVRSQCWLPESLDATNAKLEGRRLLLIILLIFNFLF